MPNKKSVKTIKPNRKRRQPFSSTNQDDIGLNAELKTTNVTMVNYIKLNLL